MLLCQIIWLTWSHMPVNQHQSRCQFLVVGLVLVGWHMALCKPDDMAKWHFLLFLGYILIFWALKGWFIELNLSLGSDIVWVETAQHQLNSILSQYPRPPRVWSSQVLDNLTFTCHFIFSRHVKNQQFARKYINTKIVRGNQQSLHMIIAVTKYVHDLTAQQ